MKTQQTMPEKKKGGEISNAEKIIAGSVQDGQLEKLKPKEKSKTTTNKTTPTSRAEAGENNGIKIP